MKIEVQFAFERGHHWHPRPITPDEYFDRQCASSPFEWDDVPDHLCTSELFEPGDEDLASEVRILRADGGVDLLLQQVYWSQRRHIVTYRRDIHYSLLIVQLFVHEPRPVWHTLRMNCHPEDRGYFEHLQTFDDGVEQTVGPSCAQDFPAGATEVRWGDGRSRCSFEHGPRSFRCDASFITNPENSTRHRVFVEFAAEEAVRVTHDLSSRTTPKRVVESLSFPPMRARGESA